MRKIEQTYGELVERVMVEGLPINHCQAEWVS